MLDFFCKLIAHEDICVRNRKENCIIGHIYLGYFNNVSSENMAFEQESLAN